MRSRARLSLLAGATILLITGCVTVVHLVTRHSPDQLLARADKLSWNNQWIEAAPLYADAERQYTAKHQPEKALYAHVSQFIPRAEREPLPELILELRSDLQLPAAKDRETRLRILTIEGMIETNYDASMARKTWAEIQGVAASENQYLLVARAMGEQGIADFLLGDLTNARKLVLRAWLTAKVLHDPAAHVRYASVYGAGLVELGRYAEGLQALDEAISTARNANNVAYPSIAVNSKIDALRGLHRYDEALKLADEAISRLPPAHLDAHLFEILTAKGTTFADEKSWSQAAVQYDQALGYARQLQYWRGIVQTGGLLAQAYEHENQLDRALNSVDEAIRANTRLPEELYFSPRNLAIKAEILARRGRSEESHALYEKSFTLLDSLIATAPTPTVERLLIGQMRQSYSDYFESLCQEGHLAMAFLTIEKARGRIEAQSLQHHVYLEPHAPTSRDKEIAELNLRLLNADDPRDRNRLAKTLTDAELDFDNSTLSGKTAKSPMELLRVQKHLGPAELVLEYVLSNPSSYVLAITATSLRTYKLPSESAIDAVATKYRKAIHDRKADTSLAQDLFGMILSPVSEYREKHTIIVIPDGQLHLLPFSALVDGPEYTLQDHTFTVSPSSTVLCLLRDRQPATKADAFQYVGVAAWTEPDKPKYTIVRGMPQILPPIPRELPLSRLEVETIARDFPPPSTVLLGAQATKIRFKALPLDQYRVLHLALHGHADLEYPDRSALVFSPSQDGKDDGLLDVREIRALHLKANLVTLSACDTGVGPIGEADIANLGNAFVEAGADTVVTALWDLQDRSTEKLMTAFYRNLAAHKAEPEALREAQLDLKQAGLPPFYWASFELVGNPSEMF